MIAKGLITQRANDERLPAQTIERDYVLAHICADIGIAGDTRLVFKGGTLLRLCYFADYRYSVFRQRVDHDAFEDEAATRATQFREGIDIDTAREVRTVPEKDSCAERVVQERDGSG
jgi:predicted nucleotidyltransferase component of viral defense system